MNRSISWMKYMALAAVLVMVLSGCGAAGGSTNGAAQASGGDQAGQAEGGNLTFALATSPDTLDPHRSGLAVTVRAIRTIYDNLVVQTCLMVPSNLGSPRNGAYPRTARVIRSSCVKA